MLSSSSDGTVSIWDAHKPDLLCELYQGQGDMGIWAEFSMLSDYIVSDSFDNIDLLLWQYKGI